MDINVFENHKQWPDVKRVCAKLADAGFKAWLAGGCVRDLILKTTPKDFDVVTDAKPDQIQSLFLNALPIGKKFGIVIVPFDGFQIEIATFRKDGDYKDGRHPETVSYASPLEDASRRDFTMNAIFFDLAKKEIIDYVEGQKDILEKKIKTVGEARKRFSEDKLRVLRAFRFVSQLDFELDYQTFLATQEFTLEQVSRERIQDEVNKILMYSNRLKALSLLDQSQILFEVWPEVKNDVIGWTSSKAMLSALSNDHKPIVYWAVLLLFVLKDSEIFLKKFKFSNESAKLFQFILKNYRPLEEYLKMKNSQLLPLFAQEDGKSLLAVVKAYTKSHRQQTNDFELLFSKTKRGLPTPLINAKEIIESGITGAKISEYKKTLYSMQLDEVISTKKEALDWLRTQK